MNRLAMTYNCVAAKASIDFMTFSSFSNDGIDVHCLELKYIAKY